ncbi:lactoylglutathione lyase [Methylopila jiangsuensis]|uniref:Lactoylglutathione lyase n=1 Tax=Methylopila jiangsuensis TaxID=586230 RepID=A0A9W6JDH4_9HYPH|nr:VOC family protein [Methylopila jiangsuensis]MDR6285783.1 catechol 2,3-dioxygenase-like lactoylglutathione lyase family enzyme [Methylopila jiangsuensis]GLK75541.1 lactoylglutathione lyase [Methylopila jiangsuensis]
MAEDAERAGPPPVSGVLETALYVADLVRAARFYDRLFGFPKLFADARLIAYDVGGRSVLLLFAEGAAEDDQTLPGGVIPGHDGRGGAHMAFAIAAEDLSGWNAALERDHVAVEGRVQWPRGGVSLYFRDPDGNLLELATPGLWTSY